MNFYLHLSTKDDILKNEGKTEIISGPYTVWLPTLIKIFFYVEQLKETHTGLEQLEGV